MTTVQPKAFVETTVENETGCWLGSCMVSLTCPRRNAEAALASPPAKLTGPEKVTVIDRTSDRWALAVVDLDAGDDKLLLVGPDIGAVVG